MTAALAWIEAAFWLTRPHIAFSKVPLAAAGWVIGRGGASTTWFEAALLAAMLASMQTLMFVVNDLMDAERDRVSAPFLPIPRGLVSPAGAVALTALLACVFLGSAVLLAPDAWVIVVVLLTIPAAFGTMVMYGRTKAAWYSPVLATMASSSFVAWAWLVAGARHPGAFALLFAIASLHGVHANLRSQLRDIEGDPKAGTVTLAARLGPKRTLMIAAVARLIELIGIAVCAFVYGAPVGGLWLVPALALFVVALIRAPEFYARTRDRRQQTDEMMIWVHLTFVTELAAFGAFRPIGALALGAGMAIWFRIVRAGYYKRLVDQPLVAAGMQSRA